MKVTVPQFKLAFAAFADEMLRTIKDKKRRAAAGFKMVGVGKALGVALDSMCKDGMVDVDEIKEYVMGAMRPCDGEIPYTMEFVIMGMKVAEPVDFTFKQEDVDKFFNETLPAAQRTI